jgi:hypothetical protein
LIVKPAKVEEVVAPKTDADVAAAAAAVVETAKAGDKPAGVVNDETETRIEKVKASFETVIRENVVGQKNKNKKV